jgi:hypothetical protein
VPFVVQKIAGQQSMITYVPSDVLRIGRGTNAELRFDDIAVALEHAVIEPVEHGYRLLDRGSGTGTYLNGKPVREALLSANDLINIGGYQIRVQITDPDDPLFLSVRTSAPVLAPPAATTVAPPRVIAAAVQAAAAQEAARRAAAQEAVRVMVAQESAAQGAAQAAAQRAAAQVATQGEAQVAEPAAPVAAAPAPAGPAAWEVASGESVTAADAATMRMSPEALAAAVRAATAMAAAAGKAAAPAAGPAAAPAAGPAAAPAAGSGTAPAAGIGAARMAETGAATGAAAMPAAADPAAAAARTARPPETSAAPAGPAVPAASAPPSPPSPAAPPSPSSPLSAAPPSPPAPPPRALPQPPPPASSRQPSSAAPALRAPVVDYLSAYSLRRPLFNKALLALVLTAGAAAAMVFLARSGRATAFEPGRVHVWHAETACASCHSPWRGPDPALCSDCHARQREKGEIHQARQTSPPPCTGCHPEHRGSDRVTAADDTRCASCHGDLEVNPPGAEPRFARRVNAFFDDHPDFSITLPSGIRLPLAEAVARRADPTPLRFNHQRHLRPGLPTPSGQRVQLRCESCHHLSAGAAGAAGAENAAGVASTETAAATAARPSSRPGGGRRARPGGQLAMPEGQPATPGGRNAAAGGPTGIFPISYETSCTTSGCHPLTFDNRRPDQLAPHASPQRVREFLVSVYSDRRGANESVSDQYRRLIRGAGAQPRGIDYGGQAQGAVVLAERYLYGTACKECHVVDTNARPLPRVTWRPIPARWLPHGRFQHLDHPQDCQRCHGAAAASTVAADVLLPAIAICRTCHGGGGGAAQVKAGTAPAAPTDCLSCHRYHPDSPNPAQTSLASPAAPPARSARAASATRAAGLAPPPEEAPAERSRPRLDGAGSGI